VTGSLLAAIDLGTTSVRALVLEPGGRVLGRGARPLETRFPAPGRVEQDPESYFTRALQALRLALEAARAQASDLAALGIATQRATALAWSADTGRALAPAIGWQDQRSAPRVAELRAEGVHITTLPAASKFEWWLRHEASIREAARRGLLRLGTPDAWLAFRLSGEGSVTDAGQASCTALFDLARGAWSERACALFGVDPAWLPRVVASNAPVGCARALGAEVPLAARAGDQQAACFAQAVHTPGDAKLTLGTAAILDVHTGRDAAAAGRGAYPVALWQLTGHAMDCGLEGTVISAGAALDWLVRLGLLRAPADADAVASEVASSEEVAFVPALQGLGTPYLDAEARGLLGGLTRGTTRAHVVRAVLEGVAQRCVDVCEALRLDARPLHVDGGLSRSDVLCQVLADLGGRPVLRAAEAEATARGAALLAGLGVGAHADLASCAAQVSATQRFESRSTPEWRERARERWRVAVARASATPRVIR
jgi:glycerol kinase